MDAINVNDVLDIGLLILFLLPVITMLVIGLIAFFRRL